MKISIITNITPCNQEPGKPVSLTATCFTLGPCLAYYSILKTEQTCSSETSVDFQRTTLCYIQEDRTLLSVCVVTHPTREYHSSSEYYFRAHHESLCRSQWPRGLRHEPSSPARTMGSWVRIPLDAWTSVCIYSLCVVLCK
jgi:hypothetical protein